jgi:hypothetical protein
VRHHPRQRLLFFVVSDIDETTRSAIRELVRELAASRPWVIGPPQYIDTREEPEDPTLDEPIETVGGFLEIYSPQAPGSLPREVDLQHLAEVDALVEALRGFSRANDVAFELELDGTHVGAVESGDVSRTLAIGLIGEWRRQLGIR